MSHFTDSDASSNFSGPPVDPDERRTLINIHNLLDGYEVMADELVWFRTLNIAVRGHMNGQNSEDSQSYQHVQQIVKEAQQLWIAEKNNDWAAGIDPLIVFTAALVCKIEYVSNETYPNRPTSAEVQVLQHDMIYALLRLVQCPPQIAGTVAHIASLVALARDLDDKEMVLAECERYPALRIVQDAARLANLGPIAIVSIFSSEGMTRFALSSIDGRCDKYLDRMKTKTGLKEANKRTTYMLRFKEDFLDQWDFDGVIQEF